MKKRPLNPFAPEATFDEDRVFEIIIHRPTETQASSGEAGLGLEYKYRSRRGDILITNADVVLRLALAALIGGIIGYQRERLDRPAGFRTHILVCLGSALFMVVSVYPFEGREFADPTRIASQVVVGIGFLGAGTIIRQGSIVIGLTTAASLWAVAGVGLAIGVGYYSAALIAAGLVLAALTYFKWVELRFIPHHDHKVLELTLDNRETLWRGIEPLLDEKGITISHGQWQEQIGDQITAKLTLELPDGVALTSVAETISKTKGVQKAEWTDLAAHFDRLTQ